MNKNLSTKIAILIFIFIFWPVEVGHTNTVGNQTLASHITPNIEMPEKTWGDLAREGYRIWIQEERYSPNAPKELKVQLYKNGSLVEKAEIRLSIYPEQKIITVFKFFPHFPEAKVGMGRALLRHILLSLNYEGFHVIAFGNLSFQKSFQKMIDFQPEIADKNAGLLRATLEANKFLELLGKFYTDPSFTKGLSREQRHNLEIDFMLATLYGVIPSKPMDLDEAFSFFTQFTAHPFRTVPALELSRQAAEEIINHPIEKVLIVGHVYPALPYLLAMIGKKVTVIDDLPATEQMRALARRINELLARENRGPIQLEFVRGTFTTLNFAYQDFQSFDHDLVVFADVATIFDVHPKKWFEQVKRLLKRNAYMIVDGTEYASEADSFFNLQAEMAKTFPDHELLAEGKSFPGMNGKGVNQLFRITNPAEIQTAVRTIVIPLEILKAS